MTKIELGVLLTLALAIISGTYFIGKLDGRLSAIEKDKDYTSFKKEKEEALAKIIQTRAEAINEINRTINSLDQIHKQIDVLKTSIEYQDKKIEQNKIHQATVVAFNLSTCPEGWSEFKDGAGRVILGIGSGKGLKERKLLESGGQESVTLTEPQMPSHYHQIPSRGHSGSAAVVYAVQATDLGEYGGPHARQTDSKGSNQPHENMPPFIALLFCYKN